MRTRRQFKRDAAQFQKLRRLMENDNRSSRLVSLQAMIEDYILDASKENPRFSGDIFREACKPLGPSNLSEIFKRSGNNEEV